MFQVHRWDGKVINSTLCSSRLETLQRTFISEESEVIPSYSFHGYLLRQFIKIILKHADKMFFRNVKVSDDDFPTPLRLAHIYRPSHLNLGSQLLGSLPSWLSYLVFWLLLLKTNYPNT